jgi:ATP-dependent DNA ligase
MPSSGRNSTYPWCPNFPSQLSLVLGYYDGGKLIHAGRVGTGFSHRLAEDLFRRLDAMIIPKSPFARKLSAEDARRVRFVRSKAKMR